MKRKKNTERIANPLAARVYGHVSHRLMARLDVAWLKLTTTP